MSEYGPLDEEEREELDWLIESGAALLTEWELMPTCLLYTSDAADE